VSLLKGSSANYAGDGPTRRYGCLNLNGIYVVKISSRYYVEEIYHNVIMDRFPSNSIKIGDEVIKVNQFYCEHLGNVSKYIEKTHIRYLELKSKLTGENYYEESHEASTIFENNEELAFQSIVTTNSSNVASRKRKRKIINNNGPGDVGDLNLIQEGNNIALTSQNNEQISNSSAISTTEGFRQPQNKSRKCNLELYWEYEKPCQHCDYVHLRGATAGQRTKCCLQGKALQQPFPQLKQLPPMLIHNARDRLLHMGRNSVSYNSVLCCAATGVENNDGGGFEHIHGDHAVRLHGRTYHFLTTSTGNAGLNFFTFDNLANCTHYATTTLNNTERGYERIIPTFLGNIFRELKEFNTICQECEQIGYYANEYMGSNTTVDAFATINETTSK